MAATSGPLTIGNGAGWSFLNGRWRDGDAGELLAPESGTGAFMAVADGSEYGDFEGRFRFRFRYGHAGVRLVFRLQDATRYYGLDIPWCGQQNRNRHMWAGLVIADGTPLQRYLDFRLIPEVVPRNDYWYEGRVECAGARIRAWVEGRLVGEAADATYASGRVGVMSIGVIGSGSGADVAAVTVTGAAVGKSAKTGLEAPGPHWICPCPETDPETFQSYPGIIQSKSGELTASIPFGNPNLCDQRRVVWVRSRDAGRTWSGPEAATLHMGFAINFVKEDGTWVALQAKQQGPAPEAFYSYESSDEGHTWRGPKRLRIVGDWPEEMQQPLYFSGQPLRLRDGTLLATVQCRRRLCSGSLDTVFSTNYVLRSSDDGETWAGPVWCDGNNSSEGQWFTTGDFSETGLAEAADNVVIGYGRPGSWPYMWRLQSNDGGKSWEPASFGAFPGYCISLTGTTSGALVAVHRFPYLGANVSYDGGVTWDAGTIIDYPAWANQQALEVEPNVVLVNYMGYIGEPGQADRRVVRLRVTDEGLAIDS